MNFSKKLINWYLQNKRDMPWRKTKDPYRIWLSEIILQQTKVAQGLPYYLSFVDAFPTVFKLANAKEEKVLKLWQGLGYYSRARNLHTTAIHVANKLNGVFPNSYTKLLELKGIGDYTASAIASICYNENTPVVDGNVYRVLSRYYNIDTPINTTEGKKEFKNIAVEIMDTEKPSIYNQAIMEFGALQCKPMNPNCDICPLGDSCGALSTKKVKLLPVKLKKNNIKIRFFNFIIFIINEEETIIRQRTGKGIWQNLYEFPLIEANKEVHPKDIESDIYFKSLLHNMDYDITPYQKEFVIHKLSHQHLYTKFYIVKIKKVPKNIEAHEIIKIKDVQNYPVPILLGNFINSFF